MKRLGCLLCFLFLTCSGLFAKWTVTTNIDPITDEYCYKFVLDDGSLNSDNFISITCNPTNVDIELFIYDAMDKYLRTMTERYDSESDYTTVSRWFTDYGSIHAIDPAAIIKEFIKYKKAAYRPCFTDDSTVTLVFDLSGFREIYNRHPSVFRSLNLSNINLLNPIHSIYQGANLNTYYVNLKSIDSGNQLEIEYMDNFFRILMFYPYLMNRLKISEINVYYDNHLFADHKWFFPGQSRSIRPADYESEIRFLLNYKTVVFETKFTDGSVEKAAFDISHLREEIIKNFPSDLADIILNN